MTRPLRFAPALVALAFPLAAAAQTPPPGGSLGEEEPKVEGGAEKAPDEPGQLPSLPVLPAYPNEPTKKFELLELNGYFRVRTDWFSNLHLGFHDLGDGTPFREPLSCDEQAPAEVAGACSSTIGTANMRLRLEPVIRLSENVSVHVQIDVLDNLVLGATPDGVVLNGASSPANIPANAFSDRQVAPEAGRNYITDSIRVKRAWGEVLTPLGRLRFGRMPSHWGMGLLANSGGEDPIHGTYCTDCDHGDTADRVMFGTLIPGTSIKAAIALDWASSEPGAAQSDIWRNRYDGQPWDLDDADDVNQYILVLLKNDEPAVWNELVKKGKLAANYGLYFVYRTQDYEAHPQLGSNPTSIAQTLSPRGAQAYIPDLWGRVTLGGVTLEAELVGVFGSIDSLNDISTGIINQSIFQLGGVARLNYKLMNGDLDLGLEVGFASGDQWEALAQGTTNVKDAPFVPSDPNDKTISNFRFDFDYHVDLILFRELLGTVTNATYVKPTMSYWLTDRFQMKAQAIASFANVPVATPGNGTMYGIELDADVGYYSPDDGFFAGISYGVLFPLDAMDHPVDLFSGDEAGDAGTAQTLQTRLVLKF
jgi:uncharacterized protein (TIGR04551 family)